MTPTRADERSWLDRTHPMENGWLAMFGLICLADAVEAFTTEVSFALRIIGITLCCVMWKRGRRADAS